MIANRQLAFGKAAGNKLPIGVFPIEYLKSTGTQWINTEVSCGSGLSADVKFRWLNGNIGGDKYILGMSYSDSLLRVYFGTYQSKWMFGWGQYLQADGVQANVDYVARCVWQSGNASLIINQSVLIQSNAVFDGLPSAVLYLLSRQSNPSYNAIARLYYCKLYRDNILVRDFIPVRKGNVGYMYDKVSGELFGNQGTGEFVLGPDIIDYTAKDYIQDGLQAWWDRRENVDWGVFDPSVTNWVDLKGGVILPDCVFSDDFSGITKAASRTEGNYRITSDFTLHSCLRTCPERWSNWTMVGIGDRDSTGLQKGICFTGGNYHGDIEYRMAYSGTIYNNVTTGVAADELCAVDIVFLYDSLLFKVFVNGAYKGESQIARENWVLDNIDVAIGTQFLDTNHFGNFCRNDIGYYNRALTTEEIAHNYEIDKQRFGL